MLGNITTEVLSVWPMLFLWVEEESFIHEYGTWNGCAAQLHGHPRGRCGLRRHGALTQQWFQGHWNCMGNINALSLGIIKSACISFRFTGNDYLWVCAREKKLQCVNALALRLFCINPSEVLSWCQALGRTKNPDKELPTQPSVQQSQWTSKWRQKITPKINTLYEVERY